MPCPRSPDSQAVLLLAVCEGDVAPGMVRGASAVSSVVRFVGSTTVGGRELQVSLELEGLCFMSHYLPCCYWAQLPWPEIACSALTVHLALPLLCVPVQYRCVGISGILMCWAEQPLLR